MILVSPGPASRQSPPLPSLQAYALSGRVALCTVFLLSSLYAGGAVAADVCSNSPTSSDRVVCVTEPPSTDAIDIDLSGIDLDTTGDSNDANAREKTAVFLQSEIGNTSVNLDITGKTTGGATTPSTIDTTGNWAHGIYARHKKTASAGPVTITLTDTQINTSGTLSKGLEGRNDGYGDLTATLNPGVTIGTTGDNSTGIRLEHTNDSSTHDDDIVLNARGITVTTQGTAGGRAANLSFPVWATRSQGPGDVRLDISDSTLSSTGDGAIGIYAVRTGNTDGNGDIDIDLEGGRITTGDTTAGTTGITSHGIFADHARRVPAQPGIPTGNIEITTGNHAIETTGTAHHAQIPGTYAYGIFASHSNNGNIRIDLGTGSSITTAGKNSHGIVAYHYGTEATRSMNITVDGSVTVNGEAAQGVRVGTVNSSGVPERMAGLDSDGYRRHTVKVNGPITSAGEGVFLANGGRVIIGPGGSIRSGSGIAILATGTVPEDSIDPQNVIAAIPPKLRVDLNLEGRRVSEAIGDDWIINDGGETTIAMNNTVLHDGETGNTGNTARNGAWNVTLASPGVRVTDRSPSDPANWTTVASTAPADRDFSAADFGEVEGCPTGQVGTPPNCRTPPPPTPPPPSPPPSEPEVQEHQVNEAISAGTGAPAGVVVRGSGVVYIGALGSIEAASGIAILATEDNPDLLVDIDLAGRRIVEVIGNNWIINDGGGTTLVINGVKLHDGETGVVPGAQAPNGARNVRVEAGSVRILEEGVRVLDRSDPDPANWVISPREAGVIADRDFSAADFVGTQVEPEPVEPGPEPQGPVFIEEYAPRAALYEALPEFLLGLHTRAPGGAYRALAKPPRWIELRGSSGSLDFDRSTVGAKYDAEHLVVEAGGTVLANEHWNVGASLHHVTGSADVSSPVRGGDIHVKGVGLSFDARRHSAHGHYAAGQISWTNYYDLDLSSDTVGRLVSDMDAEALALHIEAGRRIRQGEDRTWYTPHVWLGHTRVSVDSFTDTVQARASFPDAERYTAGLGLMAETVKDTPGGELALMASLDIEHKFGGADTSSRVSGERLSAEPQENRASLALGSAWRQGPWTVDAMIFAREGSDDDEYSGSLNLGLHF